MTDVRAAVCRRHGPPEVVAVETIPPLPLGHGQVRIHVGAAAVNFPDVLLVADEYQVRVPAPFVPGSELAGVVAEVGDGVDGLAVGDRVIRTGLFGAFAQEAVAAAASVTRIPAGVDEKLAAAFGVAHRTAFHALRSVARVEPGEALVVLGAGGGVGLAAVQLGVLLGASVTAVASSTAKLDVAASYGATTLVDHRAGDLRQALRAALPGGADAVLDPVGGDLSEPALRSLRRGGRFVTIGYASGVIPRIPLNLVLVKGVQIRGLQLQDLARDGHAEFLRTEAELFDLLATGRVVPHIGATFPLDEAAAALRHVADGHAIGKVVLDVTR
ncbi:NADPH:quinone oxidoreductase family protein [Actinophytocola oryzae]|uniref:NADPH:quinone reductase-like Zn-dependent oxidoreductase n=1 Tax=Actinophytocola oryzae TaxID=502181 RepID=A0A4R7VK60_9PSEU|nr:NADPH:quinone oxidoreductase family protein [Actinophytocola oryzae]TDV49856.1 NADPH:quinone reductase-like Zn-dependent oxidoreductase [Actinophytocola oryzae]